MVTILENFKVDDAWVVAIEVHNEATGKGAGSSLTPAQARMLAKGLMAQANAAEAGRAR